MKVRTAALALGTLGFLLGVMLAGCNSQGVAPQLTEQETEEAWNGYQTEAQTIADAVKSDPAIGAILELAGVQQPLALNVTPLEALGGVLGGAGKLVPLFVQELPRGGFDDSENQFEVETPYDLEYKWTTGQYAFDLRVDWDKDAKTISAKTQDGDEVELPQHAYAELAYTSPTKTGKAGTADFTASWYPCGSDFITEPQNLKLELNAGVEAKVNLLLSYALGKSGDKDTHAYAFKLSTKTSDGQEASLKLNFESKGQDERDASCFVTKSTVEAFTFKFESSVPDYAVAFELNAENVKFSDTTGAFESADVSGYAKINGRTAFTFEGVLNDLDESCPGKNVTLRFADRETTLADWLAAQGYCTSAP